MASILDDIKQSFVQGTMVVRFIYINLAVFIGVSIINTLSFMMDQAKSPIVGWLSVPSSINSLITKPWTLVTYMFLHEGFLHLLFNLLWLYFGGRIFVEFLGAKRFISTYILGGFAGAFLYILFYNIFPVFAPVLAESRLLGASASVLAIILAIATYLPNYEVRLILLGPIKLKYIAIASIVLDIVSIPSGNAGGHIAHLGGAIFGYFYIRRLQKGSDWSVQFFRWWSAIQSLFSFRKKPAAKMNVAYKRGKKTDEGYRTQKLNEQEQLDAILDKISKSGYDSLTAAERDFLFKASQKR